MSSHRKWLAIGALLCISTSLLRAQGWSEKEVVAKFESLSPQARELRARVAVAAADVRTRTVYPNPSVSYSKEGAGYVSFLQGSQTLPISGRMRILRDSGDASVAVADAEREAEMWSLTSDLRIAFYRAVAAQERMQLISASIGEVERLVSLLRKREEEGEGSRYDRLRAERELIELRTDMSGAQSLAAAATGRLSGFLPEESVVKRVNGTLELAVSSPDTDELVRRALADRAELRAVQNDLVRVQFEQQAASRLRIPEPTVTAGVKRGDVPVGLPPTPFANDARTALAFSISVPIPAFNRGQYEVARFQAEQVRAHAVIDAINRRIRTEVRTARDVWNVRKDSLAVYKHELESAGSELTRITEVAYQEGDIGILELLDSLRVARAADLRLLDLRAGAKEAFIELERAVGEEVRP